MREITTIGLDLAKNVFQAHAAAADGSTIFSRKLRRSEVLEFFQKTPPCLVGLEACGGAHHWARQIRALGHEVRMMPPAYVKPFVKRGKTDAGDAEAISEAVGRKTMRFVPIKPAEQQADAVVLKTRALLVGQQTQAINALRAHLAEFGIIAGAGKSKVAPLIAIVDDEADTRLPSAARFALHHLAREIERLIRSRHWRRPSLSPLGAMIQHAGSPRSQASAPSRRRPFWRSCLIRRASGPAVTSRPGSA